MPICHQILFHVRCRLGLELIGYRVVEKVYERFPLLRAANPLLFHKDNFFMNNAAVDSNIEPDCHK